MRKAVGLSLFLTTLALCVGGLLGLQAYIVADELHRTGLSQGIKIVWAEQQLRLGSKKETLVHGRAVHWYHLVDYGPLVVEELSLYPQGALGALGLKNVLLTEDLTDEKGKVIGGMGWGRTTLFLNAQSSCVFQPQRARTVALHHEIFHTLDRWGYDHDKAWEANSKYLRQNPVPVPWDDRSTLAGFIDNYSQSCPGEDKAEVFAYLMIRYRALQILSAKDPVLNQKVRLMKARLATLDPRFDAAFWQKMDSRPLANSEWAWENEGERMNLEPPHPPYEPIRQADQPAGPRDPNAAIERSKRERDEFLPPAAPR